jgi:ABC-type glycerol-3-phosphate transport system permease component
MNMTRGPWHSPAGLFRALLVAVCLIFFGFPIYWMLRGALIDQGTWMHRPAIFFPAPRLLTLRPILQVFTNPRFHVMRTLINTAIVATLSGGLNVVYASMAGFALAKMALPCRRCIIALLLLMIMVPIEGMMVCLFLVITKMHLFNTLAGIILPLSVSAFNVILMWKFFSLLPDELVEAAIMDGADWGAVLFRIALPAAAPGATTIFILSFVSGWEAFIWPLLITDPGSSFNVFQEVLAAQTRGTLAGGIDVDWPQLMAFALVGTIPMFIIFLLGQRFFVAGLTQGAVKE